MMNNETVILSNLCIGYQGKNDVRVVASNINASIRKGELTCLLGANGVGKSTLLRTLSAFQPKLEGEIMMRSQETGVRSQETGVRRQESGDRRQESGVRRQETGDRSQESEDRSQEIATFTDKELSKMIGVVLTEKPDIRNMSVRELVALGRSPYTGFWGTLHDDDWQVVDKAIRTVRIETLKDRMIHTLSDGERQKAMIAKALAQQTPVIYLDEPTAFLDFPSKVEMMQLLRRLAQEQQKTIFLSTHDFELALQVADTLWLMESQGLSIGTPRELADSGALARYVERPGITFDPTTLSVRIKK